MPLLGMHVEEGVDGKRLKFLRDALGARVWRLHKGCPFSSSTASGGSSRRRGARSPITQNAIFGRCCMNPDKFRKTNAYVDPAKFERAMGKSSVTNFELQINDSEGFLAFVEACMSVPTQVGTRTLQLSKLVMEKACYLRMRRLFPKMRLLFDSDGADLRAAGPAPRHGRGEPERRGT